LPDIILVLKTDLEIKIFKALGYKMSSASKKRIHSPIASFIPRFLAEETPALS